MSVNNVRIKTKVITLFSLLQITMDLYSYVFVQKIKSNIFFNCIIIFHKKVGANNIFHDKYQ